MTGAAPAYVHKLFARVNGPGSIRLHVSHATKLACYKERQSSLWIAGYLLDLCGTEEPRLLGTGRRRDQKKRENGLGSNWVVCRHSVPEIRASRSPREPMCLCRGGSRTNQAGPKSDAATSPTLQPPARPTGGQNRTNRTELIRGLTHSTHEPASLRHNVTRVVWISQFPQCCCATWDCWCAHQ